LKALAPLGAAFGAAARLRAALYARGLLSRARLSRPVISVGNLAVGGRSKTPVVEHVARLLHGDGRRVAILSRGYRGSYPEDARRVRPADEAAVVGDEPLMLARRLPDVGVFVGRRRVDAGRLAEQDGRDVHLLDDGFQHLALHRDLDVVCLAAGDLTDAPMPAGRLREPVSALGRAGLVLVDVTEGAMCVALEQPTLHFRRAVTAPVGVSRPFLLCAIARPERFLSDARGAFREVVGEARFRDHHAFTPSELAVVSAQARAAGADAIVTTAKDAVRLPAVLDGLSVRVLQLGLEIEGEETLVQLLRQVAGR
jgi:tetraacyldisaccharide 4'-kinase